MYPWIDCTVILFSYFRTCSLRSACCRWLGRCRWGGPAVQVPCSVAEGSAEEGFPEEGTSGEFSALKVFWMEGSFCRAGSAAACRAVLDKNYGGHVLWRIVFFSRKKPSYELASVWKNKNFNRLISVVCQVSFWMLYRGSCFLTYTAENSHHLTAKIISKEALF